MKRFWVFVIFVGFLWSFRTLGFCAEGADLPSLIASLKDIKTLSFCGEGVPLKSQEVRERFEKELLLALWDRPQVLLWLKRSRRYLPSIEKLLKKNKMPDDLKYIAIAESALRPHVGSRKGAMGFWQFMRQTGQKYGLAVNDRIDERRNIHDSTRAAIKYFKELHEIFGSWTLAAAAFNMGENGLLAEMLEQGTRDYYKLYLPLETQRYVFRVLSVKMIFSQPKQYGFLLSKEDFYPPIQADKISIECIQETPIKIVAQAAKTRFKVIKDLNPEIRGHHLAKGKHHLLIPKGAAKGFKGRYERHFKTWKSSATKKVYVVKKGDNLSAIAERFDVPLAALLIWNRLNPNVPIRPGDRLIIHGDDSGPASLEKDD